MEMENRRFIRVPRSHLPTLAFEGELITHVSSRQVTKSEKGTVRNPRWYELALYQTVRGTWVVAIQYHTEWTGETNYHVAVEVNDDPLDVFAEYDPTAHALSCDDEEKEQKRNAFLCANYQSAVDEIAASAPELDEILE